jgi:hypothetical protein
MEYSTKTSARTYRGKVKDAELVSAIQGGETETVFLLSKESEPITQKYEARECMAFDFRFNVTRLLIYSSEQKRNLMSQIIAQFVNFQSKPQWVYAYNYLVCHSPLLYFLGISYKANRRGCPEIDWVETDRISKWAASIRALGVDRARDIYPQMVVPDDVIDLFLEAGMRRDREGIEVLSVDREDLLRVRSMSDNLKLTHSA